MVVALNDTKVEVPHCYEVLSTRIFQQVYSEWNIEKPLVERDYFLLFNILAGTKFKNLDATPQNEAAVWASIRWFIEQPFDLHGEIVKVLQFADAKIVTLPKEPKLLSIGQNIHLRQAIESSKYVEQTISIALAIYLQPLHDESKFDMNKARELEKQILEMPITVTGPAGFFLLQNALRFGNSSEKKWHRILHSLNGPLRRLLLRSRRLVA